MPEELTDVEYMNRLETMGAEYAVQKARLEFEVQEAKQRSPFRLTGVVKSKNVEQIIEDTRIFQAIYPGEPIILEITSRGGHCEEGFALFDHLRTLESPVVTKISGFAGSMAGVLSQAGDERVIGRHSRLHIHRAATWVIGKAPDLQDIVTDLVLVDNAMAEIYAERSKLTKAEILERIDRKEWYLNAQQAKRLGFVDRIE